MEIELASVDEAKPEQLAGSVIGEALPIWSFGSTSEQAAAMTIGCDAATPSGAAARGARAGRTIWSAAADAAAKSTDTASAKRKERAIASSPCQGRRDFSAKWCIRYFAAVARPSRRAII